MKSGTRDRKRLNALASNVARLSNLLTRERGSLPHPYLRDKGLREAYIAYYLPANMSKIHLPLRELTLHPAGILRKGKLRILDLGTGPGTAIFGAMEFFSSTAGQPFLEFTAVDPIEENLTDAERLFQSFKSDTGVDASLLTIKTGIEKATSLPEGPFDIIILSNVLSEVCHPIAGWASPEKKAVRQAHSDGGHCPPYGSPGEMKTKPSFDKLRTNGEMGCNTSPFLLNLWKDELRDFRVNLLTSLITRRLAIDGSCIIIEPALRETSRELLEVRECLLKGGLHIYSPCLMNDPCPALTDPKDWCHEDIPWEPPPDIREIDKLTGLRKDSLKFSYLMIRKDTLSLNDVFGNNAFRVVSEPLISKGKIEFYLCGTSGRRLAVRLDKDKSRLNEPFSRLKRGDIVSFQDLIDEGKRLKVDKGTTCMIARPAPLALKYIQHATTP